MKWFLSVFALLAGMAIVAASCGPKEHFCPTTNPDPNDFTCHPNSYMRFMETSRICA